jgi:hypothetical protein
MPDLCEVRLRPKHFGTIRSADAAIFNYVLTPTSYPYWIRLVSEKYPSLLVSSASRTTSSLAGSSLAPIFTYNSGHPFNLLAGADINSDGHFTNDRPPGAGRNTGVGPDFTDFDMRLSRAFKLGEKTGLNFTGGSLQPRQSYQLFHCEQRRGPEFWTAV